MADNPEISGRVVQGARKAVFFTSLAWVKKQCHEKFRFIPFPGTLNLELKRPLDDCLKGIRDDLWEELIPPDETFCSSKALPISIGQIKGALISPESDVKIHGSHVIEIMAPVKLRDVLRLNDGDRVRVRVDGGITKPVPRFSVDAVLFDLDGTLIDSIESYYRIVEIVLEKMEFPKVSRQIILKAAKNDEFNWDDILPDVSGQTREETAGKAWQMIEKIYPDLFLKNVRPFPDTGNVLSKLHDSNIRIGIVTSTPQKNMNDKMKILDQAGISDLIDVVICAGDAERKKPFPDPLNLCRERMELEPDRCVYVGDMGIDILAGRAAGMKTIGVLTGFETYQDLAEKNPDAIIDSISDLSGVLDM